MIRNPRAFFTQDEKKQIDAAVAQAEKGTSGEIVPVLAGRAGAYTHGLYHAGLTFLVLATFALFGVHLVIHEQVEWDIWAIPLYVLVPVQLVSLFLGFHLARRSWNIHRAFLPRALLQQRVDAAARRAFRDLDLHETKDRTGIMLYVSLFERVAVVLADKGIASKCPQSTWDGVRDLLIAGLKSGNGAKGYADAIAECGRILAKDFPPTAENPNELPNELRLVP